MVEQYYEELKKNVDSQEKRSGQQSIERDTQEKQSRKQTSDREIRENLSQLRSEIKEPQEKAKLFTLVGDGALLIGLLATEEPKVRKNAALLLGDLELQSAAGALLKAYKKETTLFVKSSYLSALAKLDVAEHLDFFKARLAELTALIPEENEKKHIREEIRELDQMILAIEGVKKHTFTEFEKEHDIILTTNRELRSVTMDELQEVPADVIRGAALHPLGVMVHAKKLRPFTELRTCREMLFPIRTAVVSMQKPKEAASAVSMQTAKTAAAAVWNSDLPALLKECHKEGGPFYFRLELKSGMELDKKTAFAKRFAAELESCSGRSLINSAKDYELEIRLIEKKEGGFISLCKLYTVPMKRFSYRKNAIAASIHPALAAALVELARPWMKENAQILDPFCGVGTMLIERNIKVPAREKYGIDIFGEAILMARENTAAAGMRIHYINRDYFDFMHEYFFDEIITNMPVRGKKTREEMDAFYADFFTKSKEILLPGGVMILYSNEESFIKKQLRLNREYRLLKEFVVREKEHFGLFVIGYK